jgi:SAM-dependent methyltransferase
VSTVAEPGTSGLFYRVDFAVDDGDELQRTLNDLYGYGDDPATRVLHRCRLNLFYLMMKDLIAGGVIRQFGSAIDVGCNAGGYSKMLSDFGFEKVEGFDVGQEYVARAQAAFGSPTVSFAVGRAEDLAGSYDFVLCTEVIEHTDEPLRVVENLKRALKPGGVAIVSMPNGLSLPYFTKLVLYKLLRRPISEDMAAHLSFPSYRALKLFEGDGVRVLRSDGTNLFFNTPLLKLLHRGRTFTALNELNFRLARLWPLKYFSQFFFVVLTRG